MGQSMPRLLNVSATPSSWMARFFFPRLFDLNSEVTSSRSSRPSGTCVCIGTSLRACWGADSDAAGLGQGPRLRFCCSGNHRLTSPAFAPSSAHTGLLLCTHTCTSTRPQTHVHVRTRANMCTLSHRVSRSPSLPPAEGHAPSLSS